MDRWTAFSDPTHGLESSSYVVESAMAARPLSAVVVRPRRELFTFHGRAQPNCCSTSPSEREGTPALGRREALGRLIGAGIAGGVGWSSSTGMAKGGIPEVGLQQGRLRGCSGSSPCVSTSAFQSPSRFMPPWTYLGTKEDAYNALRKALARMGAQVISEDGGRYMYAVLSSTNSTDDIDDLEFLFSEKVVCYRSVSRVTIPDPPFCWWPGCINGPRNRGRLERLRDDLGWVPLETDEDKRWVPLLLH